MYLIENTEQRIGEWLKGKHFLFGCSLVLTVGNGLLSVKLMNLQRSTHLHYCIERRRCYRQYLETGVDALNLTSAPAETALLTLLQNQLQLLLQTVESSSANPKKEADSVQALLNCRS